MMSKRNLLRCVVVGVLALQGTLFVVMHQKSEAERSLRAVTEPVRPVVGRLSLSSQLHDQCVSLRFRGDDQVYTLEQGIEVIQQQEKEVALQLGLSFLETPEKFFPVRLNQESYHMYHFVELLVIAFANIERLARTKSIRIPWIFTSHSTVSETCGSSNLNCLIADLVLKSSRDSIFQRHAGILGLPSADPIPTKGTMRERKAQVIQNRMTLAEELSIEDVKADAVLQIERFGCSARGINKPWADFIDDFPADLWRENIARGLGLGSVESKTKVVVSYIDRQSTDRTIPEAHHQWILDYFSQHDKVEFRHLKMETLTPLRQIEVSATTDLLIGVHGNGLTHQLWMAPHRFVVELFWRFPFQYDYATAAQLMQHHYVGLANGAPLPGERVAARDPQLRQNKDEMRNPDEAAAMDAFETQGKTAIRETLEAAMRSLL